MTGTSWAMLPEAERLEYHRVPMTTKPNMRNAESSMAKPSNRPRRDSTSAGWRSFQRPKYQKG